MNEQAVQLSCQELVELVTDYLEGGLPEDSRLRFENHLSRCDPCTVYLEQMRQTISLLGHLPQEAVSPQAETALLEAFRGWQTA